jgi:glycerol uptake facilitator-like aquaporin
MNASLPQRLLAEFLGTALLVTAVVGSGIAATALSPNDVGLELLENAAATAVALYVLILMFGKISGAHFNPVVTFVDCALGGTRLRDACAYVPAQVAGAIGGAVLANAMYSLKLVTISTHNRGSGAHWLSETVATLGLLLTIFALTRSERGYLAASAVGAYIGGAYWFTSSTSFANPAVAVGRIFSNTFAGIAPSAVPGFVAAEIVGGVVAFALIKVFYPAPAIPAPAADLAPDVARDAVAASS